MRVFWGRGYAAASIEALTQATGLNRSSLYHAWGDKAGLFTAALDRYAATRLGPVAAALETGATLADSLRNFFRAVAALALAEDGGRGCLVSCALTEAAALDPDLARALSARFDAVEQALAARIARAAPGERAPQLADVEAAAAALAAVARGMMLRARAGADRAALERIGDAAAALASRSA